MPTKKSMLAIMLLSSFTPFDNFQVIGVVGNFVFHVDKAVVNLRSSIAMAMLLSPLM